MYSSLYEDRCFAAAGPKLWNSLPAELRQADISFQRFKRLLKTFLFRCWDRGALWLTVKAAPHEFSYLLTYLLAHNNIKLTASSLDALVEVVVVFCWHRTIEELLSCMRSSVADSCGDAAGRWLLRFKSLIMLPVQEHLGCSSSITGARFHHHHHRHPISRCAPLAHDPLYIPIRSRRVSSCKRSRFLFRES